MGRTEQTGAFLYFYIRVATDVGLLCDVRGACGEKRRSALRHDRLAPPTNPSTTISTVYNSTQHLLVSNLILFPSAVVYALFFCFVDRLL